MNVKCTTQPKQRNRNRELEKQRDGTQKKTGAMIAQACAEAMHFKWLTSVRKMTMMTKQIETKLKNFKHNEMDGRRQRERANERMNGSESEREREETTETRACEEQM